MTGPQPVVVRWVPLPPFLVRYANDCAAEGSPPPDAYRVKTAGVRRSPDGSYPPDFGPDASDIIYSVVETTVSLPDVDLSAVTVAELVHECAKAVIVGGDPLLVAEGITVFSVTLPVYG